MNKLPEKSKYFWANLFPRKEIIKILENDLVEYKSIPGIVDACKIIIDFLDKVPKKYNIGD